MAMNPRTHPRGAPPDFSMAGLPPNPNPERVTDALWWLVCMRLRLEPLSDSGGILAIKPGYHSYGSRLPDHGQGDDDTDHSIRRAPDRTGPWWRDKASAHDWTFTRAHTGNYTEIKKYCNRLRNAMRDPADLRPDDVYAYFIGQIDNDLIVEGYNEYRDAEETGDDSHLWHRHDSFRRNIIGDFWAMWKALSIDMGWTYAEWQRSVAPQQQEDDMPTAQEIAKAVWNYLEIDPATGKRTYRVGGAIRTLSQRRDEQTARIIAAIVAGATGDQAALDDIEAQLANLSAQVGQVDEETVARLKGSSPQETADLLRVVLGDDAAEVGRILAEA
jgi:hypothetical protein